MSCGQNRHATYKDDRVFLESTKTVSGILPTNTGKPLRRCDKNFMFRIFCYDTNHEKTIKFSLIFVLIFLV